MLSKLAALLIPSINNRKKFYKSLIFIGKKSDQLREEITKEIEKLSNISSSDATKEEIKDFITQVQKLNSTPISQPTETSLQQLEDKLTQKTFESNDLYLAMKNVDAEEIELEKELEYPKMILPKNRLPDFIPPQNEELYQQVR